MVTSSYLNGLIIEVLNQQVFFKKMHVHNSTLAGGVAIGAIADLQIRPFAALVVGSLAGIISVLGYQYVTPFFKQRLYLHDTCGIHNLHGMPGVLSGIAGVIVARVTTLDGYNGK
jgi:ammonium transporter Rh